MYIEREEFEEREIESLTGDERGRMERKEGGRRKKNAYKVIED